MEHNNPLISIVIPVYNVEKYLSECIDSVLGQTYTNLEVILVDDGSTDSSPRICDKYAAADGRVRVIHKQNGGLSDARNAGIDIAAGEYIAFADSDDWIALDMIQTLYDALATQNADISICGVYKARVDGNIPITRNNPGKFMAMSNTEASEMYFNGRLFGSACAKLYKKSIFQAIRYPAGKIFEDAWVIIDVFMAADKIIFIPVYGYYYRKRVGSISHMDKPKSNIAARLTLLEMFEKRHCIIEEKYSGLVFVSRAFLYRQYLSAIELAASAGDTGAAEIIISKIKKIPYLNITRNNHLTKKDKVSLCVARTGMTLYKLYNKLRLLVYDSNDKTAPDKHSGIKSRDDTIFD